MVTCSIYKNRCRKGFSCSVLDSEYRELALPISNHTPKAPLKAKMRWILLAMESHGIGIGSPSWVLFLLLLEYPLRSSLLALYRMDVNFHRPQSKNPLQEGPR